MQAKLQLQEPQHTEGQCISVKALTQGDFYLGICLLSDGNQKISNCIYVRIPY